MPHFFINSNCVKENQIIVSDPSNYQHIVKSLRANIGETLKLIDENEIEYLTKIVEINNNNIVSEIQDSYKSERKLQFELYIAQSPLRSNAQVLLLEKATELGVAGVYPIYTDNCALKKNVLIQKIDKWQNAMYAASKQCERANVPICYPVSTLDEAVQSQKFDKVFALCERDTEQPLRLYLEDNCINKNEKVLMIIGPEGGFSENEFKYFKTHSIPRLSLGDLILKAETAAIISIGNVVYEYRK